MKNKEKFIAKITSIFEDYNIGSVENDDYAEDVFAEPDNMDAFICDVSFLIDVIPLSYLYKALAPMEIEFDTSEVYASFVDDKKILSDYIDEKWFNEILIECECY